MTSILQQASLALSHNDAETLEHLCAEAGKCTADATNLAEYTALLTILRRQLLAARANIVLRHRLLAQHPLAQRLEMPWAP